MPLDSNNTNCCASHHHSRFMFCLFIYKYLYIYCVPLSFALVISSFFFILLFSHILLIQKISLQKKKKIKKNRRKARAKKKREYVKRQAENRLFIYLDLLFLRYITVRFRIRFVYALLMLHTLINKQRKIKNQFLKQYTFHFCVVWIKFLLSRLKLNIILTVITSLMLYLNSIE